MSKVSKYKEITLSSIDGNDLFYIVDDKGSGLESKCLKYSEFLKALNRDLEQVQVVKGCSYNKETKVLELSIALTDGSAKVLSIDMDALNVYHAQDGVTTLSNDDNVFVIDWDKVAHKEHSHQISDVIELDDNLSDIADAISDINSELSDINSEISSINDDIVDINSEIGIVQDNISTISSDLQTKALSIHTHVKSEITDFGSYLSSSESFISASESFLTSDALDTLSVGWESAKNKLSAFNGVVPSDAKFTDTVYTHPSYTEYGSGFYKIATDVSGHVSSAVSVTKGDITALGIPSSDTTYSTGYGLSANGTEFGVDTDKIAKKDHTHPHVPSSDVKSLAYKDLSDIAGNNIKIYNGKLSADVVGGGGGTVVTFRIWD